VSGTQNESTPIAQHEPATQDSSNVSGFIWAALAVLLAYPLSIGPVARFYGKNAPLAVRMFYAPLGLARDRSQTVKEALDWYADLWGAHL
jgi:hypothetical protein